MTTSLSVSVLRCSAVLWRIRMASIWLDTVATESSLPRSSSGKPQSTTMRMSTPISRATSIGQVRRQPAVHQHAALGLHRREHAGRRQAGAHRRSQVAAVEDHAVAGDDVGGDGAERDGEVVEVLDLRHRQRERRAGSA